MLRVSVEERGVGAVAGHRQVQEMLARLATLRGDEEVPATDVAARAVEVLGGQPGVSDVVPTDDGLEVTFAGDDAATAALLRALVEAGIPVVHFARAASSLEEIFMQLTETDDQG